MTSGGSSIADDGSADKTHVYPLNDLREHVICGLTCWCKPVLDDWGVIVHNSMDRRELYERGDLKPS